jgi:hypothetical protein
LELEFFSHFFSKDDKYNVVPEKMKLRASFLFAVSLLPVLLIITFREIFEGFASAMHAQDLSVNIYVKIKKKQIHLFLILGKKNKVFPSNLFLFSSSPAPEYELY